MLSMLEAVGGLHIEPVDFMRLSWIERFDVVPWPEVAVADRETEVSAYPIVGNDIYFGTDVSAGSPGGAPKRFATAALYRGAVHAVPVVATIGKGEKVDVHRKGKTFRGSKPHAHMPMAHVTPTHVVQDARFAVRGRKELIKCFVMCRIGGTAATGEVVFYNEMEG